MFEFIRKHKETFAILSGIITAAFFLWNFAAGDITSLFHKSTDCVATVNGDCVSITDFRRLAMRANQQLTPLLKEEILNSLIDDDLLYQQSKKEGFTVSDKEVADIISKDPSFQVDGKFNFDRYKAVLAEAGYTPKSYENYIKKQLIIQKYSVFMTNASYVTHMELDVAGAINNTLLSGKAYIIEPTDVNINYTPTEQEIENYYNTHKDEFKTVSASSIIYWDTTDKNKAIEIYKSLQAGKIPPGYKPFDKKTMSKPFGNITKYLNPQHRVLAGNLGNKIYIFTYQNSKNSQILPLSQARNQVVQDLLMQKKIEQLGAFATNVYNDLKAHKQVNIKPVAFNNLPVSRLGAMVDMQSKDIPLLISTKTPAFFGPYVSTNGTAYVIIELDSRSMAPVKISDKDKEQLENVKANVMMNYLIKYLREHAKIDINKELFKNL